MLTPLPRKGRGAPSPTRAQTLNTAQRPHGGLHQTARVWHQESQGQGRAAHPELLEGATACLKAHRLGLQTTHWGSQNHLLQFVGKHSSI